MWFDNMTIPKGAKNIAEAHEFIYYILDPAVIARISNQVGYPNPNKDATELVDAAIRNNPVMYVTPEMRLKLFGLESLPLAAERARTRAWNKIKTGK